MSASDWQQRYGQKPWQLIHHTVSIAGQVIDALSYAPIVGALVWIASGPSDFEARRAVFVDESGWQKRAERFDRRLSRADGRYFFLDLPSGKYRLQASAPELGSRYGAAGPITVSVSTTRDDRERIKIAQADLALPPTCVRGRVTRGDTGLPIAGARIRLRGDTNVALTGDDGWYLLSGLVKGTPTIEASAKNFVVAIRPISLLAGQAQEVNIALDPA